MIIERTPLPGIGTCHATTTRRRQRVGVIRHRTGRRDVVVYDPDEPQRVAVAVPLDPNEAHQLAGLLATCPTCATSDDDGPAAARTGPASSTAIAVIRDEEASLLPGPEDAVVVMGPRAAVEGLVHRLDGSPAGADPDGGPR